MSDDQTYTVQINYKSGQSIVAKAKKFSITDNTLGGRTYTWNGMNPDPLMIGADDIESVWELP